MHLLQVDAMREGYCVFFQGVHACCQLSDAVGLQARSGIQQIVEVSMARFDWGLTRGIVIIVYKITMRERTARSNTCAQALACTSFAVRATWSQNLTPVRQQYQSLISDASAPSVARLRFVAALQSCSARDTPSVPKQGLPSPCDGPRGLAPCRRSAVRGGQCVSAVPR